MDANFFILILIAIIPVVYKYCFWLYAIQLKEYRFDRFREYLTTPQGKSALFNFWFFVELPVFIMTTCLFFEEKFESIIFVVVFYFLVLQNIFIIGKAIRKRILVPKITSRLLLTLGLIVFGMLIDMSIIMLYHPIAIYSYILINLMVTPIIIFIAIIISLPIVNYLKRKKMSLAIEKSKYIDGPLTIGITGSYGKSSVKEFLSQILEQEGHTLKTPENINTELGVADIIINKLKETYDYFVVEMGAYRVGEIEMLGKIANHKHGILTAIGNQHLGLFGGIENTKIAKCELAQKVLENHGTLYINWENNHIRESIFPKDLSIVKYGNFLDSNVTYFIKKQHLEQTEFEVTYKEKTYKFKTNLIGTHNILNLTGVIALCLDIGIGPRKLSKYVQNITPPKDTLEIKYTKRLTLINDSYNISENGLFAGIESIHSFENEKVLIVDDILELGYDSQKIHFHIGKKIAEDNIINKIMLIGTNFKNDMREGLLSAGFKEENIIVSTRQIKKGSLVLFEGRNTKKYFDKLK